MSRANYDAAKVILLKLNAEIVAGRGDGERADALREESEPIWERMTEVEREELQQLSASLDERDLPTESNELNPNDMAYDNEKP